MSDFFVVVVIVECKLTLNDEVMICGIYIYAEPNECVSG